MSFLDALSLEEKPDFLSKLASCIHISFTNINKTLDIRYNRPELHTSFNYTASGKVFKLDKKYPPVGPISCYADNYILEHYLHLAPERISILRRLQFPEPQPENTPDSFFDKIVEAYDTLYKIDSWWTT